MDVTIEPAPLRGTVEAPASKSVAHRMLVLAALCPGTTDIACNATSDDIDATVRCLEALGARIARTRQGFRVRPLPGTSATDNIRQATAGAKLDCGESGSTLRFLLPLVCALGRGASFVGAGRLAERPLSPLYELLEEGGCTLSPQGSWPLVVSGRLRSRDFTLPGDVSSQYVTGLLLASCVMDAPVRISVEEPVQSRPYIRLTIRAMEEFGMEVATCPAEHDGRRYLELLVSPASTPLRSPGRVTVEGDWSGAAFWLCAGACGDEPVAVTGLDLASVQGDRAVLAGLALLGARVGRSGGSASVVRDQPRAATMEVADIPDLVPALATVAAQCPGRTRFTNAGRLRLKESDRLATTTAMLESLGGRAHVEGDTLVVEGVPRLAGGTVDAAGDHRIAMAAAIAATHAQGPTTILGADCVAKSYPRFFDDFRALGGHVHERS